MKREEHGVHVMYAEYYAGTLHMSELVRAAVPLRSEAAKAGFATAESASCSAPMNDVAQAELS
jgi:hypothetical protein